MKKLLQLLIIFKKHYKSRGKPNKMLAGKGSELCKKPMNSWLQDDNIEMYSRSNVRKDLLIL